MDDYYYVYTHFDPNTGETLYVGMGKGVRAYTFSTTKVKNSIYYVHRNPDHSDHLNKLLKQGYLPHEWINFKYRGLSKKDALVFEKEQIELLNPKYNRKHGFRKLKFNKEDISKIQNLRNQGCSYENISKEMGCYPMTIFRILNNQSPRYKELLQK